MYITAHRGWQIKKRKKQKATQNFLWLEEKFMWPIKKGGL
jgi:hypothetical protein